MKLKTFQQDPRRVKEILNGFKIYLAWNSRLKGKESTRFDLIKAVSAALLSLWILSFLKTRKRSDIYLQPHEQSHLTTYTEICWNISKLPELYLYLCCVHYVSKINCGVMPLQNFFDFYTFEWLHFLNNYFLISWTQANMGSYVPRGGQRRIPRRRGHATHIDVCPLDGLSFGLIDRYSNSGKKLSK